MAVLVADEHLDLLGESQEAAVEVAGDPLPAAVGDTVRGLGGVVALVPAEQHDLGAVVLSAQQPRLVLLAERAPEVAAPVRPALGLEPPAAVGVALEAHQRALALVPGAVFESVRVARAGGDLRADAEVTGGGLLAAARGQLVDVLAQLLGVMPVPVSVTDSLRTRPPEASNRCQSMSHTTRPPARSPSAAIASSPLTVSSRRP